MSYLNIRNFKVVVTLQAVFHQGEGKHPENIDRVFPDMPGYRVGGPK